MIVVDASAALAALLINGSARRELGRRSLFAPHLIDSEVASALRRQVLAGRIDVRVGGNALQGLRHLGLTRYPVFGMAERIWELRETVTPYDAAYVAIAEALDCPLLTADARLGRAPGPRCPITVVRD